MRVIFRILGVYALPLVCAVGLGGCTPKTVEPTNGAPTVGSIAVSPTGTGVHHVTQFTFTAQNPSDPEGKPLSFAWDFGDGTSTSGSATVNHVYDRSGSFDVRVTVTDDKGASTSSLNSGLRVTDLNGVWDVTLVRNPSYPLLYVTSYTLILVQTNAQLAGVANWRDQCGVGQSKNAVLGTITNPRQVNVGIESWPGNGGAPCGLGVGDDTYITGSLDTSVTSMTGACTRSFCTSFSMVRR